MEGCRLMTWVCGCVNVCWLVHLCLSQQVVLLGNNVPCHDWSVPVMLLETPAQLLRSVCQSWPPGGKQVPVTTGSASCGSQVTVQSPRTQSKANSEGSPGSHGVRLCMPKDRVKSSSKGQRRTTATKPAWQGNWWSSQQKCRQVVPT